MFLHYFLAMVVTVLVLPTISNAAVSDKDCKWIQIYSNQPWRGPLAILYNSGVSKG